MKKEELDQVFAPPPGGAADDPAMAEPDPAEPDQDDDPEAAAALDAAIDEAFSSDDPTARREAFKRAVSMCHEGGY